MKSKSEAVAAPRMSAKEAEARRKVEAMLTELEQINRETREIQRESDIIGERVDTKIAHLKEKLGF